MHYSGRGGDVVLSVVIPHYGDPAPTQNVIQLIKQQSANVRIQCIVVDDCSPVPFPDGDDILVVVRDVNGGFGAAVNSGAVHATGDLLLILNSDVEFDDGFLERLLSFGRPWMPAVVSPWVVSNDGDYQWVGRRFPTILHQVSEWLTPLARWRESRIMHRAVGHEVSVRHAAATVVEWVVGACMLLPLEEFTAVGGFDERFFMNAEEVDLQRRLRDRGVPSVVLGSVRLTHAGGGSSDPLRRRQWLVDGRFRYAQKWGGKKRLAAALSAVSVANAGVNVVRQARGVDVDARRRLREELHYVRQGWRA